jgi:anti-sigma B factor antagonist
VWVRGEHDAATQVQLSTALVEAAGLDGADIVVDLSGVTFMDASTIGTLVAARNRLRATARSLSVRAPSPPARRLLDVCGLERLIDEHSAPDAQPTAAALASWVDVPAQACGTDSALPQVADVAAEAHSHEPARAPARRHVQLASSAPRHRAVP